MLQITEAQFQRFRDAAADRFEGLMVEHACAFAPDLYGVIGREQMRLAVAGALERGRAYGFTFRGSLRLFVELTLLYGSGFDEDPQYPVVRSILVAPRDQMVRAQEIIDHIDQFQSEVAGPDACNVFNALQALSQLARAPDRYVLTDLTEQLVRDMTLAFPEKVAYVTEPNLRHLIGLGRNQALGFGFEHARAQALIPILMFAFGYCCTDDPLYPWIGRTLNDPKIASPRARAERLERKALTWLDHILTKRAEA